MTPQTIASLRRAGNVRAGAGWPRRTSESQGLEGRDDEHGHDDGEQREG
jgi:hypothetical protein